MTKKDYEVIAAAIRQSRLDVRNDEVSYVIDTVVERLATVLKATNEKFNIKKFYDACEVREYRA